MTLVVCPNLALDRVVAADDLRLGATQRTRCLGQQAGGKGPNVMRALAALGSPALLVGCTGDHMGELIAELAVEERFAVLLLELDDESRVSTVVLEPGGRRTDLFEEGPRIGPAHERALVETVGEQRPRPGEWAIVTGAAPAQASPAFYAGLAVAARGAGYRVMIDAAGEQLHHALAMRPDLAKVNAAEAAQQARTSGDTPSAAAGDDPGDTRDTSQNKPGDTPEDSASLPAAAASCRHLVAAGAAAAVVTRGARGAVALTPDGRLLAVTSPSVEVVNAVGSGDCFAAGLLHRLESGSSLEQALPLAAAAAAANAATLMMGRFEAATAQGLATQAAVTAVDGG
jgi:1-phosphofructokinase family hexose kinase